MGFTLNDQRAQGRRFTGRAVQSTMAQVSFQLLIEHEFPIARDAKRIGRVEFHAKRKQNRVNIYIYNVEKGAIV